jgi:hypothetical protein
MLTGKVNRNTEREREREREGQHKGKGSLLIMKLIEFYRQKHVL